MKKRFLSILLIITMLASEVGMLAGCGKTEESAMKRKLVAEGVLSEENLSLSADGIGMTISPVTLESEANAKIGEVFGAPSLDDTGEIELQVYDFSLEGVDSFDGVIELTIPLKINEGETAGAAYLNEATGEWEPVSFSYDSASESVIIITDHLSKYGVFSTVNAGARKARLEFLGLWGQGSDENYMAAIEEFASNGSPGTECLEIGAGAMGDALQLGGDFLGNIAQSAGFLAYGEDVMSTLGDYLGNIGLLVSVVQVGINISKGKINDAVAGSMKVAWTYIMGKAASKLSSSVMSASMASIAFVDYAINKFGTEALEGRASIYRDAYSIYYSKGDPGYRSSAEWFKAFYPLFAEGKLTDAQIREEVDRIVTENCNEFWGGANKDGVDAYVNEARDKMAWTGGQAGLNDSVRKEISDERRSVLYNDVLPGVFNQIGLKINLENERKLCSEYQAFSRYLNTAVSFSLTDSKKMYADHIVRFAPLNEKAVVENWTGKIKPNGSLNTSFTLYGHMTAGAPDRLDIFEPDADPDTDEPIRSISFKVTPPEVEIILGEEISSLQYESGEKASVLQAGLNAALREAKIIEIDKEGKFEVQTDFATASGGSGNDTYSVEVSGFSMNGSIDPSTFSGSASFNFVMKFVRKEKSPLEAMEGETKEYITGYYYDDVVSGTAKLSGDAAKVSFSAQMHSDRSGFTKLQYHSIDGEGTEYWGENPTITDKSGEIDSVGAYSFSVIK
ncbi:MAG: hypothetical protein VB120_08620 [Lachnospiraceae bacterium]|nr:hypothetical protein [Lachnospiraceae bacterium]